MSYMTRPFKLSNKLNHNCLSKLFNDIIGKVEKKKILLSLINLIICSIIWTKRRDCGIISLQTDKLDDLSCKKNPHWMQKTDELSFNIQRSLTYTQTIRDLGILIVLTTGTFNNLSRWNQPCNSKIIPYPYQWRFKKLFRWTS